MTHHRVAIVFDPRARTFLRSLADSCHVWLVASDENSAAAREYWASAAPVADALASGVTIFERDQDRGLDALVAILEVVEDHHGEFAHEPPLDEALIVGIEPSDAVLDELRGWGFVDFESEPLGLLARRRAPY